MRRSIATLAAVAAALLVTATPAGAVELVENGGFETGDFTGWTVENQPGGSGDWFVYSGDVGPLGGDTYGDELSEQSGVPIAEPPEGTFAATSDQPGPGSHILYQDVALPAGQQCSLTLIAYYTTQAPIATPDTLDYTEPVNQQYRIDVMDPAAAVDSLESGDILQTLFHTQVGDPQQLAPTPLSADLSAYAGRTVRLRFAEVDNQENFDASVDAVSVECAVPAPEPVVLAPTFTG